MFNSGQVPIWWDGPRALLALEKTDLNYAISPMGSPYVKVTLFMITQNALARENRSAAVAALRYFGSAAVQKELALAQGIIPANSTALNSQEVQAQPHSSGLGAALQRGTPWPNHPYGDCQWLPLGEATLAIWKGEKSPVQAMNEAQQAAESCVAARQE